MPAGSRLHCASQQGLHLGQLNMYSNLEVAKVMEASCGQCCEGHEIMKAPAPPGACELIVFMPWAQPSSHVGVLVLGVQAVV